MPEYALVDRLQPGDHVCWAFDDDLVRDRILAAYVSAAARDRHKVIYFPHSSAPEQFLTGLAAAGIDVDTLTRTGQLEARSAATAYLSTGYFDATAMIDSCFSACAEARADGYAGLRLAGDMSWAASPVAGAERLGWYEAQVTRVYAEGFAIGLCLYDTRLFEHSMMREIRAQHPGALDGTTDTGWKPMLRLRTLDGAVGLQLDGETDLSNRGCLIAMLDRLQDTPAYGPAILDVTALRFADVAAAHAVVVAAARAGELRVVGASDQFARLLAFVGGAQVPGLVVETAAALRTSA